MSELKKILYIIIFCNTVSIHAVENIAPNIYGSFYKSRKKPSFSLKKIFNAVTIGISTLPQVFPSNSSMTEVDQQNKQGFLKEILYFDDLNSSAIYFPIYIEKKKQRRLRGEKNERKLNVFLPDSRVTLDKIQYPEMTVGKISFNFDVSTYGHCTATLIARNYILTNAHCVFTEMENSKNQVIGRYISEDWKGSFRFYPFYNESKSIASASWEEIIYPSNYPRLIEPESSEQDWAIIKLDEPLGDVFGWMALDNIAYQEYYLHDSQVNLAGYSGDYYSDSLGVHYGCRIRRLMNVYGAYELAHDCDAESGSSGSALYQMKSNSQSSDGFAHIVALNHAHLKDKNKSNFDPEPFYTPLVANFACETHGLYLVFAKILSEDNTSPAEYKNSLIAQPGLKPNLPLYNASSQPDLGYEVINVRNYLEEQNKIMYLIIGSTIGSAVTLGIIVGVTYHFCNKENNIIANDNDK